TDLQPITWVPPLWVMEGMAEFLSVPGLDVHTDMWMRMAVLEGELLTIEQLSRVGDIRVYRFGQSLLAHIGRVFGDEAVGAWFRAMARRHSLARGTEETIGLTLERLSADWADSLRVRHLPELAIYRRADAVARGLTDHARELASFYIAPAVSPNGGEMVYISNASLYTDLYLASAIDGSRPERIIRGQRKETFEAFRFHRASFDWSPDGNRIALVAKTEGRERLLVFNVRTKKVERSLALDLDELLSPVWSPDGQWLVFVGLRNARSNLYMISIDGEDLRALTDDRWADFQPSWSADGRTIAYVTDHGYRSARTTHTASPWKIALLDLETSEIRILPNQAGKSINPQWFPDGRHLLFVSDRTGISNLFIRDLETHLDYQISDLLGGVSGIMGHSRAVGLSADGHRLVFSALEQGGWNLYAMRDPLALLDESRPWRAPAIPDLPPDPDLEAAAERDGLEMELLAALVWADVQLRVMENNATALDGDSLWAIAERKTALAELGAELDAELGGQLGGELDAERSAGLHGERDAELSGERDAELDIAELFDNTDAVPESLDYRIRPYRPRLSLDIASAGGLYASGFGLLAQSTLVFSDMLGDKNLYVAVNVSGSLEDGNYMLGYSDLGGRPCFSAQLYQYWTGYGSSTLPGYIEDLAVGRIQGLGVAWIHPLSRFRRLEMGLDTVHEKIYKYIWREAEALDPWDLEWEETHTDVWYLRPQISWVFDSSVFGSTGPLSGRRTRLSAYSAFGQRNAHGVLIDHRLYFNIRQRYSFAWRGVTSGEWGPDRHRVICGGPYSLRGYTHCPIAGSWIAFMNMEFRFPFIEGLYIAWPLPLLLGGIRGALFWDLGAGWDDPEEFRAVRCGEGRGCRLADLKSSFGLRTSVNLGLLILRWDLARRSDLSGWTGKAKGELSIGWEF
nr:PD40 domain-containing protein [Candidatus Eisenbacteria bacterium]